MTSRDSSLASSPTRRAVSRGRRRRGWLGRVLEPFFVKVAVENEATERLRRAHEDGIVVHALRSSRVVDPLFIRHELEQLGLPRPEWLHDHFLSAFAPTAESLASEVRDGHPTLLFLRRPRTLMQHQGGYSEPYVEALIALQRGSERPILLLPEAVIWVRRAQDLRRGLVDSVFGDREAPGTLRELIGFIRHHVGARYHVGAPINLKNVLEREAGQPDHVISKKVRWSILHHLAREEQLRTGPPHRSASRTRQAVANDPSVRRVVQSMTAKGKTSSDVEKKVDGLVRSIAADMRFGWIRFLDGLIDLIWDRIYDGIVVDQTGFEKVRRAARRGPVVVVPSHKSHVDYLVLSQVFFKEGMIPPHIAAGENLNFWPMGTIFRRSGAFFIRRSFGGDKLYAAVFAAYVRRLMKEGHVIEFFIEGGRSRTGKLLAPRMGMLSMCLEPVTDGSIRDISVIPVSIGYEKVVEAKSYARELAGASKKKEDVGSLLTSGPKVLRSRYGRVYVDFDEPISVREFASSRGIDVDQIAREGAERDKKQLTTQLGHRVVYGINHVTRVTPTSVVALILLSRTQLGLAQSALFDSADRVLDFLTELGARTSESLHALTRRDALREALGLFAQDGFVKMATAPDGETVYQIGESGRIALDYYKNTILHFFVPYAVVTMAVLAEGRQRVPDAAVRDRAQRLSQLLKHEVSFRVERFGENFELATMLLRDRGILSEAEGMWSVAESSLDGSSLLAGQLAVFFETYRLVAESLAELSPEQLGQKEFIRRTLLVSQRQVLEGRILRPEGATRHALESALSWLVDAGIASKEKGQIRVADEPARAALVDELTGYLKALVR
jgi:glycerol-3-phosphate O-acyltransferase